jgi:hypothetical protein
MYIISQNLVPPPRAQKAVEELPTPQFRRELLSRREFRSEVERSRFGIYTKWQSTGYGKARQQEKESRRERG